MEFHWWPGLLVSYPMKYDGIWLSYHDHRWDVMSDEWNFHLSACIFWHVQHMCVCHVKSCHVKSRHVMYELNRHLWQLIPTSTHWAPPKIHHRTSHRSEPPQWAPAPPLSSLMRPEQWPDEDGSIRGLSSLTPHHTLMHTHTMWV